MSNSTSKLKGCVGAIGVVGGILGIITSIIVIYQFVSGQSSLAYFFSPATTAHPSFIGSLILSDHIPYNSFWTWFWWIILGILFGFLDIFVITSIKNHELDAEAFFGGIINGIFWGTLCGFLSSLLFNFLHIPAGFLASIGVECLIVVILFAMTWF